MPPALNPVVSASESDRVTGILRAQQLIDQALLISHKEICASAQQFENLATQVGVVLDLTAGIVSCLSARILWVRIFRPPRDKMCGLF